MRRIECTRSKGRGGRAREDFFRGREREDVGLEGGGGVSGVGMAEEE